MNRASGKYALRRGQPPTGAGILFNHVEGRACTVAGKLAGRFSSYDLCARKRAICKVTRYLQSPIATAIYHLSRLADSYAPRRSSYLASFAAVLAINKRNGPQPLRDLSHRLGNRAGKTVGENSLFDEEFRGGAIAIPSGDPAVLVRRGEGKFARKPKCRRVFQ